MKIGEICNRDVVTISPQETVRTAAELMRKHHVGDVVVVESREGKRMPLAIITDRDLVMEVLIPGLAPEDLAVREVAFAPLATIGAGDSLFAAMEVMEVNGVRRLPVVESDGSLGGILSLDDLSALLAGLQSQLSGVFDRQRKVEKVRRP
jgi:signal-transduction protein with cAMP-binding, CBS, and nucleotidyltransferase domain